jgi:hypothetical protein
MRTLIAVLLFTSLASSTLYAAASLRPLIVSEETAAGRRERFIDRSSARTLLRMTAPVKPARMVPNLKHEADVTSLDRVLVIRDPAPGKIVVEGATSLRLHVTGWAPGTVLLVAGEDDESFERFEPSETATWTPTTRGSTVYVAVEGAGADTTIAQLAIGTSHPNGAGSTCTKDIACTDAGDDPEVSEASRAIALIRFVRGNASYVCSGGLVNDSTDSRTPYLLTAHHCISTQAEAASIEAVWDYRSPACGSPGTVSARTYGGQLLVASADTDVALLQLKEIPPNRVFLGVELSPLTAGTSTYRVSHAEGKPQRYSAGKVRTSGAGCPTAPRPRFVYTTPTEGAVAMGSSGAPLLVPGLRIAGQLFALCGPSPNEPCAVYNDVVDGAIAASWPLLEPYLDPPVGVRRRSTRH